MGFILRTFDRGINNYVRREIEREIKERYKKFPVEIGTEHFLYSPIKKTVEEELTKEEEEYWYPTRLAIF